MFEDPLPPVIRQALIDRFEGWEIVDLINLTAAQVIDAFEDEIADKLPAMREALELEENEDDANDRD